MSFDFDNNLPIYIQIVEQIKLNIISGKIKPGERLPSVRELALQNKVNPNTMQKALAELEGLGLIFTERTNGKFATEDAALIERIKNQYADALAERFLSGMKELGFSESAAAEYLNK